MNVSSLIVFVFDNNLEIIKLKELREHSQDWQDVSQWNFFHFTLLFLKLPLPNDLGHDKVCGPTACALSTVTWQAYLSDASKL